MRSYAFLFLSLFAAACTASSQLADLKPMAMTQGGENDLQKLISEADAAYEDRLNGPSLRKALDLYEQVFARDPQNVRALDQLAIGYYQYAYAYMDTDASQRKGLYLRGRDFALTRLQLDAGYKSVVDAKGSIVDALGKITDATYVHATHWAAANWARYAELEGILKLAFDISKVKKLFEKSNEFNPEYLCAAPRLMKAAYYTQAPGSVDMDLAKKEFTIAVDNFPGCYDSKLLMAQYWAQPSDEMDAYKKLVQAVLDAPVDTTSQFRLENMVAKRKAPAMMKEAE